MRRKRRTFLFGAGAELEWKAPTSSDLTEIVLNSGFKMCDNETTITKFIYQTLVSNGYSHREANFETIISVIEELVVHYSNFDFRRGIRSLHSCFFESKFHDEIRNFTIEGGNPKHGYSLGIPKGVKYNLSKISYQDETPEQFYFEQLLGELLTNISARIIEYSFHSKIEYASDYSDSFVKWMKLHEKQCALRLYTLNYDRVFKLLLVKNGIDIFEGFDVESNVTAHGLRPNVKKILSDTDGNIYYNLHGSINWDVEELDFHQLANAEIFYKPYPNLQVNNTPASLQVERGKTLMVTNIITGYQKAQKAVITPFKQMQSAFDKDCCFGDEIYIIGYSFGDEHINGSLRTAIRHNPNLKIIIVDPFFMKEDFDVAVSMKLFSAKGKQMTFPKTIEPNVHIHDGGSFIVYTMEFKEFRKRQLSPHNLVAGGIMGL